MNKQNYRTCIGGILILAAGVLSIISQLFAFVTTLLTYSGSMPAALSAAYIQNLITTVLTNLPVIALGVMLLLKKRGIIITILSGVMLALNFIALISRIIAIFKLDPSVTVTTNWAGFVFIILTYAGLLVLSIVSMNPQPNLFKKLWFLPGVCYALYAITSMITTISSNLAASAGYMEPGYMIGFIIGLVIGSLPTYSLYTIGYFLAGHWLANPYKKGYQPQQQAQYQPQYQQYQQPVQPQYDEQTMQALNYYKWQYESGAITWEQYNAAIQPYLHK